jgi:hypothetical protein
MRGAALLFAALAAAACGSDRPSLVETAAQKYPTYRELHEAVVLPTCGPRGGVCHNSKQFPDLHTPDSMLAVVGARCNQLLDDPLAIQDLCEPPGDELLVTAGIDSGFRSRVAFADPDGQSPPAMVTLTLADPVPHDQTGTAFAILRARAGADAVELDVGPVLAAQAGSTRVTVGPLSTLSQALRAFLASPYTPGLQSQLQGGDPNRNGIFGADLGGALIEPGAPDKSFLVQRILGIVPPRMPLANGELTDEQLYAFQCWIAQMDAGGARADGPIDYGRCPDKF